MVIYSNFVTSIYYPFMKKATAVIILVLFTAVLAHGQKKAGKLPKEEMSKMTPDQRFVMESNRKSKKDGRLSTKKKSRIQKKQSRKSERIRTEKCVL